MKREARQLELAFAEDRARKPGPANRLNLMNDELDLASLPPDCVAIPLTNGGYTLVDEEDLCRVDEYNWFKTYSEKGGIWYVRTVIKTATTKYQITMHRFLFGLNRGDRVQVDHKNHDGLDNRRVANLRLASSVQNAVNIRKLAKRASRYRGVSWNASIKKWCVMIRRHSLTYGDCRKHFAVGQFTIEAEAAYAFQVAAPLLKDPDFLELEEIPASELPDTERQAEIRQLTIARVKAALAGRKIRLNATSSYIGVSYKRENKNWEAVLKTESKRLARVGVYGTEIEAAYARDCAVQILKLTGRKMNRVERTDLENPGRADEIRAEVALRLEALRTGEKFYKGTSSRYRGVTRNKSRTPWKAFVVNNNVDTYLGLFQTEIEAATAYNIALSILGVPRLLPNIIPDDSRPPAETVERIRIQVKNRLTAKG